MGMSDLIAGFILQAMQEADGVAELQRSELAERFHCVPSQINYVVSTRFSPEHGYIVESRRGGGGYIRITRVPYEQGALVMHAVNSIGDEVDEASARAILKNLCAAGALEERDAKLILAAVGVRALQPAPPELRSALRAAILKQILLQRVG
ncbi:MAG: CtsR family transcriptional regulator [Oscillospiraceae bacterium]|nr:CtsR family transcriptional regulator [Oscillospiraceae bacterium]